jgi:hypothetical protein
MRDDSTTGQGRAVSAGGATLSRRCLTRRSLQHRSSFLSRRRCLINDTAVAAARATAMEMISKIVFLDDLAVWRGSAKEIHLTQSVKYYPG